MKKLATFALLGALAIPVGFAATPRQHKNTASQEQTGTSNTKQTKKKKKAPRKHHTAKSEAKKG